MCRVDYDVGERSTFAFTSAISSGGMHLKNTRVGLTSGEQYTFSLHLPGRSNPVKVAGTAVNTTEHGSGVEFTEGQDDAIASIREFIEDKHVTALERIPRVLRKPEKMATLVKYYLEVGRIDGAIDVLRTIVQNGTDEITTFETLAALMVQRAEELGLEGAELVDELELVVEAGLGLGRSDVLTEAARRRESLRAEVARLQEQGRKEEEAREHEALVAKVRAEVERQVAQQRKETEQQYAEQVAALENQQRKLERALSEAEKRCESMEGRLEQEQDRLAKEKQGLQELATSLKQRQAELKQGADALARERKEQAKQVKDEQKQLAAQAAELESQRKQLAGQQLGIEQATAELLARQAQFEQAIERIEQKRQHEDASSAELLASVSRLDATRDKAVEKLRALAEAHREVTTVLNKQISALQKRETRRRDVVAKARAESPKTR